MLLSIVPFARSSSTCPSESSSTSPDSHSLLQVQQRVKPRPNLSYDNDEEDLCCEGEGSNRVCSPCPPAMIQEGAKDQQSPMDSSAEAAIHPDFLPRFETEGSPDRFLPSPEIACWHCRDGPAPNRRSFLPGNPLDPSGALPCCFYYMVYGHKWTWATVSAGLFTHNKLVNCFPDETCVDTRPTHLRDGEQQPASAPPSAEAARPTDKLDDTEAEGDPHLHDGEQQPASAPALAPSADAAIVPYGPSAEASAGIHADFSSRPFGTFLSKEDACLYCRVPALIPDGSYSKRLEGPSGKPLCCLSYKVTDTEWSWAVLEQVPSTTEKCPNEDCEDP